VARSEVAVRAAERWEFLDLFQAAALAEFSVISTRRDGHLPEVMAAA
jgi:hypothetical protein